MTSPTQPPKESLVARVTTRFSSGSGHTDDPEERFTRNVTYAFIGLIVVVAVVVVAGIIYGIWDTNFRPIGNVGSTEISRSQWEDRVVLERFRARRSESQVRSAIAAGSIDIALANGRLASLAQEGLDPEASLDRLVDLIHQGRLAEEEGVVPSQSELDAAVAASGSAPEFRSVGAIVILPEGAESGVAPTGETRQAALAAADAARAALDAGTPFEEVAAEYSSAAAAGLPADLGFLQRSDLTDPVWAEAVFALEEGAYTDVIFGQNGEYLIGRVDSIMEPQADTGYLVAVDDEVGADINKDNVELETIAAALEAKVIADAIAGDVDQVELAEIFVAGNTFVDEDDEGGIRASHILYAPADPDSTEPLSPDDPAWGEKQALAERAADQLRAVEDPAARLAAFAARAGHESDGPTSTRGGDLGFFERFAMVPEFADPLFESTDLQPGDIIGPVRSDFGWHVIQYVDRLAPIMERVDAVTAALDVPDADFAAIAAELSDGAEAAKGGETGWHITDELGDEALVALAATKIDGVSEAVDGEDGYYFYRKLGEAPRALDAAQAAVIADVAFFDWYQEKRFEAEDAGEISVDRSIFSV
jgi:parvulin-like peptidyl-prolyl isomerase